MMLRAIGKMCFAYAYTWTGASRFVRKETRASMPFIACYHRVVEDFEASAATTIPSMLVSARMFERHLDWLAKRFSIMSLDEIGSRMESGRGFERPAAAITFDDGYSDVYHHAYPILKRKGMPAAVFVVTGLVDRGSPQVFDRLYLLLSVLQEKGMSLTSAIGCALREIGADEQAVMQLQWVKDEPFSVMTAILNGFPQRQVEGVMEMMDSLIASRPHVLADRTPVTWSMVETMSRSGITIGSHTNSHALLPGEGPETISRELVASKHVLETHLNTPIRHFAYPDGRFNPGVVQAVGRAGYRFAYGICCSRDPNLPLLTIPRKVLWEQSCLSAFSTFSSAFMNCHTHWAFDRRNGCGHDHSTADREERNGKIASA